jgi:hypothetical protein
VAIPGQISTRLLIAIKAALPQLHDVKPLKPIDIGFGSIVVETRAGMIFRMARH